MGCAAALLGGTIRAQDAAPRKKILVAGGHPGDPEYGCGGTVAKFTSLGHDVTFLYLNRGEKGCPGKPARECSQTRAAEAQRACRILHAQPRFADQIDGEAIVDAAHYDQLRSLLEAENPDLILTHWPVDNHRDHRAISTLIYDAWLKSGKASGFYYYEVSDGEDTMLFSPTDYVDITHTEARKRAACYAHASQSPDRYYGLQSQVTHFRGIESGFEQAEAFVRHPESKAGLLP
ncbi:MAG: PIG-L family deacetylase [Acidobacteriaceae bacterium]|nr:PIG-L family deacetylase [Acidobacteriaceae bacterium]